MLTKLKSRFYLLLADERGASAIEYAMIAALIAAVIVLAVTGIGTEIKNTFLSICGSLKGSAC